MKALIQLLSLAAMLSAEAAFSSDLRTDAFKLVYAKKTGKHISVLDSGMGAYTTIYAGKRKENLAKDVFLSEMGRHINWVKSIFQDKGLLHYTVYLTGDYELAVQSWKSEEHAKKAFASSEATAMRQHGGGLLQPVVFEQVKGYVCSGSGRGSEKYVFIQLSHDEYFHRAGSYEDKLEAIDYQGALVLESKRTMVNLEDLNRADYTYTANVNGEFREVSTTLKCEEI